MPQQHPNIGMVKLLLRLLFELNVIGQQGQRQCALLHRILPDDKIRNTAPKLVQVGGDLIVHDQVHPPCADGIDQRAACARITRCDRVDTGQLGSLLQQTERMLVNHIAVIVRQRDLLQLKRRVGGKQLLLKALQTFAVRTVIHTGRNDRSHRAAQAAAKDTGINLTTQDANSDTSKMIQYIESSVTAGEDAIIINMVDPETAAQCVEAAGDVPVVFVNRFPGDPSVLNEKAVYVGSDEMTSGAFQGEFLAKFFKDQGKTDISYLMLNGILGQTSTTNRTASVLKALEDNGIKATAAAAPLAADYDRATAMDMISPLLKTTKYDCIISNNDAMALGAVEAMQQQGLDPKSVPIVGIDATADGRQAIKDGTLAMTVFQNAEGQGRASLQAAANLIDGKPIAEGTGYEVDDENEFIIWVPFEPVTVDNVADYD